MPNPSRHVWMSLFCMTVVAQGTGAPAQVQATAQDSVNVAATVGSDLAEFIRLFQADYDDVNRFFALPYADQKMARQEAEIKRWQGLLAAVDFNTLNQQGKIDYLLMRNHLASELSEMTLSKARLAEMEPMLPFRASINTLAEGRSRAVQVTGEDAAKALQAVTAAVAEGRRSAEGLRSTEGGATAKLTPVLAQRTARAVDSMNWSLREWYDFHAGYEPQFAWWARKPFEEAQRALSDYANWLRGDVAGIRGGADDPLIGDPIGRDALLADLKEEMIVYTPEELIAIGQREYDWCLAEMKKAAAEMGHGDDWKAALAEVKTRVVAVGEMDDLVQRQALDAIEFVKTHDLVTVPPLCEETWRLTMSTPDTMRVLPYSAYMGQAVLVSSPTEDMPQDDKMMILRGNNIHFSRIVVPHELIPGHHMQGFMADRIRPYRQRFSTPFFVEGWALHWEMLLWDKGYPQSPEDRIGMLFWRMHRCARIIVSLKFHLGQMQPAEMIDFLVNDVGHERLAATSEVRRYIGGDYSPLYQCGYMIGGMEISALERELVGSGTMTQRQFHDALLTYGPIPIDLARAGMTNAPLTPTQAATWRFADR